MHDKENSRPFASMPSKRPKKPRPAPLHDSALEWRLDPGTTLSGWNTTETEEKRFFERLKHKQAENFQARRSGSCGISRRQIRSLLQVRQSPASQIGPHPEKKLRPPPRDALRPRTYLFANSDADTEPLRPDLKQIVLPRHVSILSKVVRQLPKDQRNVPFTSFVRSVQEECRRSRLAPRGHRLTGRSVYEMPT